MMRFTRRTLPILVLCLYGLTACESDKQQKHIESITVEVTGSEYNWYFRYPGEDGVLGTEDDRFSERNLYLPVHADVVLDLKSQDYVYNVTLPEIGKKEIAIPDMEFSLRFNTQDEATWVFKGDQFCGFSHDTLIGKVFIKNHTDDGFYSW